MEACPAHIDIPNFIRRIEAGNFSSAARVIREKNPLAQICGIVCTPGNFCEKMCYRLTFTNKPVPIQGLHEWVASYTGKKGWPDYYSKLNGKKIAIIGAGPAGITCAYFLARLGYFIDIYEKDDKIGGYLQKHIKNGSLAEEIFHVELNQMISKRITLKYNWELNDKVKLIELKKNYQSVFLTAPTEFNIKEIPALKNVITGGRWYSDNPESYNIIESIRDGRQAAQKIHLMQFKE
jgi:NADPH-dependent glutamate synthase beta subunit-like oxidoreductase